MPQNDQERVKIGLITFNTFSTGGKKSRAKKYRDVPSIDILREQQWVKLKFGEDRKPGGAVTGKLEGHQSRRSKKDDPRETPDAWGMVEGNH